MPLLSSSPTPSSGNAGISTKRSGNESIRRRREEAAWMLAEAAQIEVEEEEECRKEAEKKAERNVELLPERQGKVSQSFTRV